MEDDPLGLHLPPDCFLPTPGGHRHPDRRTRQLRVGVPRRRRPEEAPGVQVDHGGQVQLPRRGGDLGDIAHPLRVRPGRGEVPAQQVRERALRLVLPRQPAAASDLAGHQTLATHRLCDRLLTDPPPGLAQVLVQAGGPMPALSLPERNRHRLVQGLPAPVPGGEQPRGGAHPGGPGDPLVEPRRRYPEQGTRPRVWHPVAGPLVSDEACHAHFVASFTHRTTDRLRTSRSIRSSAFSARNRFSSS